MTRRSFPTDQTHALARLATDVATLRRDVHELADLRTATAAHGRALEDLSAALRRGDHTTLDLPNARGHQNTPTNATADGAAPAPAWLTVADPSVAVAWLNELSVWVPQVWQPYLQTKTPDCWPWHPPVVAELLVAQYLWDDAIAGGPDPAPMAAWHDRWRPGAARRTERLMAGCERAFGRHKDDHHQENHYDLGFLDELAAWWATTHGTDPAQPAPGLTLAGRTR